MIKVPSPKLSIIIPVYNPGHYLQQCLDSLINQTLKDIEIILVLDCPTDGSDKVCEDYAARDARIKIVRNEHNLHIGLSRNRGLDVATGEYIGFSDDDDDRELTMYEQLYDDAKAHDADMVIGVTVNEEEGRRQVFDYPHDAMKDIKGFALTDLLGCGNDRDDFPLCINIHPHIYRRSVIEKYHIRFVDTRKVAPEDRLWNIQFLLHADKVAFEGKPLYYHRMFADSTAHKGGYIDAAKLIAFDDCVYDMVKESGRWDALRDYFLTGTGKNLMDAISIEVFGNKSLSGYRKVRKEILSRPYGREAVRNWHPRWRSLGNTLRLLLSKTF